MFDIGFTELTLLAVLGLLVLGPERLPAVAKVIGGYVRKARRTWNSVRAEIESELAAEELRKTIRQPLDELDELRRMTNERIDVDAATAPKASQETSAPTRSGQDQAPESAPTDPADGIDAVEDSADDDADNDADDTAPSEARRARPKSP